MTWVLVIGLGWLVLGVLIGVPLGLSIRAADGVDEEFERLMRPAPPITTAADQHEDHQRAGARRLDIVLPPPDEADDGW